MCAATLGLGEAIVRMARNAALLVLPHVSQTTCGVLRAE